MVTIHYTGPHKRLRLNFAAQWQGVVAFERPEVSVPYNQDSANVAFSIPILVGNRDDLKTAKVEFSRELNKVSYKIEERDGKAFLDGWFSPKDFSSEAYATGVLSLTTKAGFYSNSLVTLRREQSVELVPSRLVFTAFTERDYKRRAVAFIRVKSPDSNHELSLREVVCETTQKTPVTIKVSKLTSEMYRVEILLKELEQISERDSLAWNVTTSLGESFKYSTKCFFAN